MALRTGFLTAGSIHVPGLATALNCPLARPRTAVEVEAGIVLVDEEEAVLVGWDGEVRPLGAGLRADVQVSRDGTTLAAQEPRARGAALLHLIDLTDGSRHTVPSPERDGELHVTGVAAGSVWFQIRDVPEELRWTVGDLRPEKAGDPPPPSGWSGPGAPQHRHYPAADSPRSFTSAWWPAQLIVEEDGDRRSYPLPEGARRSSWGAPGPVWEDPDHLLIAVDHDPELGDHVLRLNAVTGAREVASSGGRVAAFVWPWPHRDQFR